MNGIFLRFVAHPAIYDQLGGITLSAVGFVRFGFWVVVDGGASWDEVRRGGPCWGSAGRGVDYGFTSAVVGVVGVVRVAKGVVTMLRRHKNISRHANSR